MLAVTAWAALLALTGCRKEESASDAPGETAAAPQATPSGPPGTAAQPRRIDIAVDDTGYHPASAPAKAGEHLVLSFIRKTESECAQQVVVQGKTTELPLNKPVEIPITMPSKGDLVFTCGMKMLEGRVAIAK
jgi:plastocyanin domain-containing protein